MKKAFSTETELDQKESVNNSIAYLISGWTGPTLIISLLIFFNKRFKKVVNPIFISGYDHVMIDSFKYRNLRIVLELPLSNVNYSDDHVEVITNHRAYYAKAVIVAIPIGVLQKGKVVFSLALPTRKQNRIMQIDSPLLNKIIRIF
ncbi:FAD-dependent oxidoreductase [Coxiella endosymbiont of Ornithodoros amblus]|uniref:FAD-dependent oxidoreductase n=1 Tax=Coxiella endosymbiont of Ornithodoros amblus TaxID=1656166 RepID=UPI00244E11C8|nr:FAD-dependent oxidoreductase [Coxiella endosymbiont of Ornithodoros amblus]